MAGNSWGKSWGKSFGIAWGATPTQPVPSLTQDNFDYRRALRIPNAYKPDPAIARMGQRMTRRNRW